MTQTKTMAAAWCVAFATCACADDGEGRAPARKPDAGLIDAAADGALPPTDGSVPRRDAATDSGDGSSPEPDARAEAGKDGSPDAREAGPKSTLAFETIPLAGAPTHPTELRFLPAGTTPSGRTEFLLLQKEGAIFHYALVDSKAEFLGSLVMEGVYSDGDSGLISMAFDPDFASNHHFYVGYAPDVGSNVIARMTFDREDYAGIPASATTVISVRERISPRKIHNVGSIGFEPGGVLWALFGEKGRPINAQNPGNSLGKLIRIVPDPSGVGYTAAPDNPFAEREGASPNVYAMGFRSPWRGALDARGRYWVGDVGADGEGFEEVNVVTGPGMNFGWSVYEGMCTAECSVYSNPILGWTKLADDPYAKDDPEVSATLRRAVWVAGPYGRAGVDRYEGLLGGSMLAGDFFGGWIRRIELDDDGAVTADVHIGHLQMAVSWDEAPDGYLYTATYGQFATEDVEPLAQLHRAILPR